MGQSLQLFEDHVILICMWDHFNTRMKGRLGGASEEQGGNKSRDYCQNLVKTDCL